METPRTNARGRIAVIGFRADMAGIEFRIACRRKYMLALRLNWYINESGKKFQLVYLVVRM